MNNTNQHLYAIYQNIHSFYEYRKLYPITPMLKQDQFIKDIQKNKYMMMPSALTSDISNDDGSIDKQKLVTIETKKIVVIMLIYPGTECENKRANMVKFINKITYQFADVIIITPIKISAGVMKGLRSMFVDSDKAYRTYKSFTYTLFNSVLPKHDLVPKYEILSKDKIIELESYHVDTNTLPKIFENDPQMVWIGANIGDVIKFVYLSETTIEAIGYCKVVPNI